MSQIDDRPRAETLEQNSAYCPASSCLCDRRDELGNLQRTRISLVSDNVPHEVSGTGEYPTHWEKVADIRVFRSAPADWERIIVWRGDMQRKGWRLLKVSTGQDGITAIFGRTRSDAG